MKRLIAFALLLVASLGARAAETSTDWQTCTTGDVASTCGGAWAKQGTTTSWTHNIVDGGAGDLQLQVLDTSQDWGSQPSAVTNSTIGATTGNIEIVGDCTIADPSTLDPINTIIGGSRPLPGCPALIANGSNAIYAIYLTNATTAQLSYMSGGSVASANIGSSWTVPDACTIADGSRLWVRIGRTTNDIHAKIWCDPNNEPMGWGGNGNETTLSSVRGGLAYFSYESISTNQWAAVSTDGENTADLPGGGGGGGTVVNPISGRGGAAAQPVVD